LELTFPSYKLFSHS